MVCVQHGVDSSSVSTHTELMEEESAVSGVDQEYSIHAILSSDLVTEKTMT